MNDDVMDIEFADWFGSARPKPLHQHEYGMLWGDSIRQGEEPAQALFGPYEKDSAIDEFLDHLVIDVSIRMSDAVEDVLETELKDHPEILSRIINRLYCVGVKP